jgi:hypothetical protein
LRGASVSLPSRRVVLSLRQFGDVAGGITEGAQLTTILAPGIGSSKARCQPLLLIELPRPFQILPLAWTINLNARLSLRHFGSQIGCFAF